MNEELRRQFQEAGLKLQELLRARRVKGELEVALAEERRHGLELERRISLEQMDIRKMQRHTFSALVHSLIGDRKTRLQKEEQDAAMLQMQIQESLTRCDTLQDQIKQHEERIDTLAPWDARFAALEQQFDALVAEEGQQLTSELVLLEHEHSELNQQLWQIRTTAETGRQAKVQLQEATHILSHAAHIDIWNTHAQEASHRRLDEFESGRHRTAEADQMLQTFQSDLKVLEWPDVPPSALARLSYHLLGGIPDFNLVGEIEAACRGNENIVKWIDGVLERLQTAESEADATLAALVRRRVSLLAASKGLP